MKSLKQTKASERTETRAQERRQSPAQQTMERRMGIEMHGKGRKFSRGRAI